MKSHVYIEDDPSTTQLRKDFAPVHNQETIISGAAVVLQQPLAMKHYYSFKTDLNASKPF